MRLVVSKRVKNGYPETQFIEDLAERNQGKKIGKYFLRLTKNFAGSILKMHYILADKD